MAVTNNLKTYEPLADMVRGNPMFDLTEYAGQACRAWIDGAQSMQAQAAEYFNARAGKDVAALSELARCTTPTDAFEMQARYASEAMADYVAGSQRMLTLLTAAAQQGGKAAK